MTSKSIDFDKELAKASGLLSQVQGNVLEAKRHVSTVGDKAIEAKWMCESSGGVRPRRRGVGVGAEEAS